MRVVQKRVSPAGRPAAGYFTYTDGMIGGA